MTVWGSVCHVRPLFHVIQMVTGAINQGWRFYHVALNHITVDRSIKMTKTFVCMCKGKSKSLQHNLFTPSSLSNIKCFYHSYYDKLTLPFYCGKSVFCCMLLQIKYCNKMEMLTNANCLYRYRACVGGVGVGMSSCVCWRDWPGYLVSFSCTVLRTCYSGANDWGSRAKLLPASAEGEHACKRNLSSRRGPLQYGFPALQSLFT